MCTYFLCAFWTRLHRFHLVWGSVEHTISGGRARARSSQVAAAVRAAEPGCRAVSLLLFLYGPTRLRCPCRGCQSSMKRRTRRRNGCCRKWHCLFHHHRVLCCVVLTLLVERSAAVLELSSSNSDGVVVWPLWSNLIKWVPPRTQFPSL